MLSLLQKYKESSRETKIFIFNLVVYGLAIILTTVYCYARLEFVHHDFTPQYKEAT